MTSAVKIKLAIALVLFFTWVALVLFKVPGSADLISYIKDALLGLGLYHSITTSVGSPATVPPATTQVEQTAPAAQ